MLRSESTPRRADEGTTRRDDRTQSESDPRLVPEQTLQGQETIHTHETVADAAAAATTTTTTRQGERLPSAGEMSAQRASSLRLVIKI